ncbi:MAG TPA: MBOAT family protein [Planctomycetota bacterium]
MLFNSLHFLAFFPVAVGIYFLLAHRWRWAWLLAASYYFYMWWRPSYLVLLVAITVVDYAVGLALAGAKGPGARRGLLVLSLISNLGLLGFFKYFNFLSQALTDACGLVGVGYQAPLVDVILPVGLSFHTFQAMAYTIDVYRGLQPPERHLGYFAVYVAFFPQLVAGPIERAGHLLPQFHVPHRFEPARAADGLRLVLWGFFKKVVVADRLAVLVNEVYAQPEAFGGAQLLLATYFFTYQLYCDFSGYSDIAVGSARLMGFDLSQNFNRPFASRSIAELWGRWHISLSTWFRDYVYIPLGGSRVGPGRHAFNLMVVFLVSGLWHGANWTFVVWGALHGLFVVVPLLLRLLGPGGGGARSAPWRTALSVLVTFHLFAFALIFFRAQSLDEALAVVRGIAGGLGSGPLLAGVTGFDGLELGIALVSIVVLELVQLAGARRPLGALVAARPLWARWGLYYAMLLVLLLFGKFDEREFIYFQF